MINAYFCELKRRLQLKRNLRPDLSGALFVTRNRGTKKRERKAEKGAQKI